MELCLNGILFIGILAKALVFSLFILWNRLDNRADDLYGLLTIACSSLILRCYLKVTIEK